MKNTMLHESIKSLLKKSPFLTQSDIYKKVKIDKVRISGYLQALVDLGHINFKQTGNSKVYYLDNKRGK